MGTDTLVRPKTVIRMLTCGFCAFSKDHARCPGGVRNGDGSIVLCKCTEPGCNAGKARCTDCGLRDPEFLGTDWRCLDSMACQGRVQEFLSHDPLYQRVQAAYRAAKETAAATAATIRAATATHTREKAPVTAPATLDCLCGCTGLTKGGKFLPGHDARYLARLVDSAKLGGRKADEARLLAGQVSPAFLAKLIKRSGLTA